MSWQPVSGTWSRGFLAGMKFRRALDVLIYSSAASFWFVIFGAEWWSM